MKRFFCISLCVLMLFSTTAFAKKKYSKRARRCSPCVSYTPYAPCVPCPPCRAYPCTCALLDVGTFWIGETHSGNDCKNPVPVFLPGSGYTYGICQTNGCTGSNCIDGSRYRVEDPVPIIDEPIHFECIPFFDSRYTKCTKYEPKFIRVEVTKGSDKEEIIVKLFTIEIDFNKIFVDYNSGLLPKGEKEELTWNRDLEDPRIIFVGLEATDAPPNYPRPLPKYELHNNYSPNNAREAILKGLKDDTDPINIKIKNGIVLLAR